MPAARTTAATTVTATAGETAVTAGTETAEGAGEEGAITEAAVKEEEGSAADTYRLKLHRAVTSGNGWVLAAKAGNIILEACQVGQKQCHGRN